MVLHQGDLDYDDDPDKWDRMISKGDDFPYFASVGEHDVKYGMKDRYGMVTKTNYMTD